MKVLRCGMTFSMFTLPHPLRAAQTEDTLKRAWGDDWQSKVTLDESRLPIGSGCIAQVYHGHMKAASGLHDAGKEVRGGNTAHLLLCGSPCCRLHRRF